MSEVDQSSHKGGAVRAPAAGPLIVGQTYSWVTIAEKTKKGDWKFQLKGGTARGHLIEPNNTPPAIQPGVEFALEVGTGGGRANDYGLRWNGSGAPPPKAPGKKGGKPKPGGKQKQK